jgi:hypothetical protein
MIKSSITNEEILDNYLIITTVNKNYLKIFDIWYHFFCKSQYSSILRVITLDKKSEKYISKKSIRTIYSGKSSYSFSKIIQWRFEEIFKLLKQGKNIIQTDADAFWIDANLPIIINERYDIQTSIGFGIPTTAVKTWGFSLCTGFMIIQSNNRIFEFMQDWLTECSKVKDDQVAFNNIFLKNNFSWKSGQCTVNEGLCTKYKLKLEAIDIKLVSRPYNQNLQIYHPYLNSNHQLVKIKILRQRLHKLNAADNYINSHLSKALKNPLDWFSATYGWLMVLIHKTIKKMQVKDDWS